MKRSTLGMHVPAAVWAIMVLPSPDDEPAALGRQRCDFKSSCDACAHITYPLTLVSEARVQADKPFSYQASRVCMTK